MNAPNEKSPEKKLLRSSSLKTLFICAAILAAAGLIIILIFSTEPEAVREGATRRSAMLVTTTSVTQDTHRPTTMVLGNVIPAREVMLSAQVGGEVIERSPGLTPGGLVSKGDLLLKIDPSDYEVELRKAESALLRARAELNLEKGRQQVARQDFKLLEGDVAEVDSSLVLREPQMATAQANVEAAEADIRRAELNLERTSLTAPFDALVLERNVNVGSLVTPGMTGGSSCRR